MDMLQDDADDDGNDVKPSVDVQAHNQLAMKQLYTDPSFAIICSFFNKFAVFLGLKPQCFAKIEHMFTSLHENGKGMLFGVTLFARSVFPHFQLNLLYEAGTEKFFPSLSLKI
ncbi:unnamed protein product [Gongylonema pulchrum]|uniref:Uncharacterized protein n=1 Tax=Gongylonema pulchrum TaxID=637853 RepID=A0A183EU76_9BILA|nr:unnamed protein product [Gongylonema pulchrum]